MAPSKSKIVLFWGRLDKDTGFLDCIKLCHEKGYQLEVAGDGPLRSHIPHWAKYHGVVDNPNQIFPKVDFIFTTGYLGLLDAYIHKKPVLYTYDNPLKQDYLLMHPMAGKSTNEAYAWAKQQTWERLANNYEKLWQK